MGGLVVVALLAGAYNPDIDTQRLPFSGLAVSAGVQRVQDDFGLQVGILSPRFVNDRLAVHLVGGIAWYPDLRALPEDAVDQQFDARALYGHLRLLIDGSYPIAAIPGRLYAAVGPSFLWLPERLSTTRVAPGAYGVVGVELFAGTTKRTAPFAFFFEIGASAHAASADVANRVGPVETVDLTIDRPIATGLALSGGLRWYFWR